MRKPCLVIGRRDYGQAELGHLAYRPLRVAFSTLDGERPGGALLRVPIIHPAYQQAWFSQQAWGTLPTTTHPPCTVASGKHV